MTLTKKIVSALLILLTIALAVASVGGYALRGTDGVKDNLNSMRTSAVLHIASDKLIDFEASQAYSAYYRKYRDKANKNDPLYYRNMGQGQFEANCNAEYDRAKAEAEAKYGTIRTDEIDVAALEASLNAFEESYRPAGEQRDRERTAYSDMYLLFVQTVEQSPAAAEQEGVTLTCTWFEFLRDSANEAAQDYGTIVTENSSKSNPLSGLTKSDDEIRAAITAIVPELAAMPEQLDAFVTLAKDMATAEVKTSKAALDATAETETEEEEIAEAEKTTVTDYSYYVESEELKQLISASDAAFDRIWEQLVSAVPAIADIRTDLTEEEIKTLGKEEKEAESAKLRTYTDVKGELISVIYSSSQGYNDRYSAYVGYNAADAIEGGAFKMELAAFAPTALILAIALALLTLLVIFWKPVTGRLGIPRTIILLFFIYLCLGAQYFRMDVSMLLGDVLMRVGMYGILVLAMVPDIQCGIGLNMGMTIGCIAGLLAAMLGLEWGVTGDTGLVLTCMLAVVIAVPMGVLYSLLLNRMKGSEMTITTYVGYSFVALMCIFWLMLPFKNPKLLNLQLGYGLRVTHSLLGRYAYVLNNFLSFTIPGTKLFVPTGLLLLLLILCGCMWLFSRSRLGIAMNAVGSNPRFAEASGISVDNMRILGTTMSTVIAAVGIVVYSSAFGYAQIYNAPRQLGFIAASAILIGGATVSKAKVSHVLIGTFLFEGVLTLGQQVANAAIAGGGLSEVMRILISNGIILYALAQSGGASRE